MMCSWGRAFRRVLCCGLGADAPETSDNQPIYEKVEDQHQVLDVASALQFVVEAVDEMRRVLLPIADVPERMWWLEQHLHPLLVYRPEDGVYMAMLNGTRPAPPARPLVQSASKVD